jgi:NAD(P)-dependent dehydrogenase (short-subunit alcohol dehydrogenase family)
MSLSGKFALITGSSRGIGRGIALKLADNGVNVAVHYYQNVGAASDTLAQVRERGADGFVVQADVLDPKQITQVFGKVKAEFGKLDIFVSNARPRGSRVLLSTDGDHCRTMECRVRFAGKNVHRRHAAGRSTHE